ncbi:hypothetical protein P8625_14780 [Tenacibaculum tangerinum]|uniref:TonB-dependent receptor n=1 Tax=Tenacibaculum tangerinum TaxID=3038772 RepID=A0ABY8L204_9FLAO|nr:hypothetical protein [Tenacibaculum tangerinum]WGH75319.1 hypothetical protein P8625_14780 [Tenacibaculum tangerinum]
MKKHLSLLVLFVAVFTNAQNKNATSKAKDTIIKTEVVNVVTSYVPKITDAFKIKQKPIIEHTKETQKKALEYQIFSVPVASTFIPKSGAMKKIDLGKRERLYPNYVSIGFGNTISPMVEAYVRRNESYDSELGVYLSFLGSLDPVENTALSSTFYNIDLNLFYTQQERYFQWTVGLDAEKDKYNWYGLPENITFTDATVSAIEEAQSYNHFKVFGNIKPDDSFLEEANGVVSFFSDSFESAEFLVDGNAQFRFPLDNLYRELNDIYLNTTLNYIGGSFAYAYDAITPVDYKFITFGVHPTYKFNVQDLAIQLGAKSYFSMDAENSENNFFIYPNVEVSYPIVKELANIFIGASGDLTTNMYQSFTDDIPYLSPTLDMRQTHKKYDAFAGIRGKLNHQFSYNFKASYADTENHPFFVLNQSKSDGTNIAGTNGFTFYGYEYGNSFKVVYDDIQLITFFGEVAFDGIKNLTVGANAQFNKFTLTNELEPWNVPKIKGEVFATYKTTKWYAGTNLYFVGNRKARIYDTLLTDTYTTTDLKSYFDVNFNGGYHFDDSFSVFLNLNNVLNNSYQRFNNFNVQGFQAMGGLTWKFDSLF